MRILLQQGENLLPRVDEFIHSKTQQNPPFPKGLPKLLFHHPTNTPP
jgi:hypothetical protein